MYLSVGIFLNELALARPCRELKELSIPRSMRASSNVPEPEPDSDWLQPSLEGIVEGIASSWYQSYVLWCTAVLFSCLAFDLLLLLFLFVFFVLLLVRFGAGCVHWRVDLLRVEPGQVCCVGSVTFHQRARSLFRTDTWCIAVDWHNQSRCQTFIFAGLPPLCQNVVV